MFCYVACQNEQNTKENLESTKKNLSDSVYIDHYSNGNKKIVTTIKDGKYHGKYSSFDEKGTIQEEGLMIMGLKNGVWKYYNGNKNIKKVLQYYNDSLIFELDKSDFSLLNHTIENERIEIKIPSNWKTENGNAPQILLISQKRCDNSIVFCPNITFTKEELKEDMTFEDYLKFSFNLLQQKLPYFKAVAQGQIRIDGLSAFQLSYLTQVNGIKLGGLTTWINKGNKVYVLTAMAINEKNSEFLKYKGLFQEVASTFHSH